MAGRGRGGKVGNKRAREAREDRECFSARTPATQAASSVHVVWSIYPVFRERCRVFALLQIGSSSWPWTCVAKFTGMALSKHSSDIEVGINSSWMFFFDINNRYSFRFVQFQHQLITANVDGKI